MWVKLICISEGSKHQTPNTRPESPYPKLETPNLKPQTMNADPEALHHTTGENSGVFAEDQVDLRPNPTTRWITRVPFPLNSECHVTKFAPRKALKSFVGGKLTFDVSVILHRVDLKALV